jgi:hypothetical protein
MNNNRCCNSWRQKCDQERNREDFKIQRPYNTNSAHVEGDTKSDTSNNSGRLEPFQNHSGNT